MGRNTPKMRTLSDGLKGIGNGALFLWRKREQTFSEDAEGIRQQQGELARRQRESLSDALPYSYWSEKSKLDWKQRGMPLQDDLEGIRGKQLEYAEEIKQHDTRIVTGGVVQAHVNGKWINVQRKPRALVSSGGQPTDEQSCRYCGKPTATEAQLRRHRDYGCGHE